MPHELALTGTTVTLFGGHDALDQALSDELGRRGCHTHAVSVASGWVYSATHVVMRLDTPAGQQAFEQLLEVERPPAHVVAVCETMPTAASARWTELCEKCGACHDIALIWHPALDLTVDEMFDGVSHEIAPPQELASSIADELALQTTDDHPATSFSTRTYAGTRS